MSEDKSEFRKWAEEKGFHDSFNETKIHRTHKCELPKTFENVMKDDSFTDELTWTDLEEIWEAGIAYEKARSTVEVCDFLESLLFRTLTEEESAEHRKALKQFFKNKT